MINFDDVTGYKKNETNKIQTGHIFQIFRTEC